jgi:hypothetical protein
MTVPTLRPHSGPVSRIPTALRALAALAILPVLAVLPVRALGFGLREDLTLQVQLDADAWQDMTQTAPGVWEADVELPALADVRSLTVRGTSSEGSSEHTIEVITQ